MKVISTISGHPSTNRKHSSQYSVVARNGISFAIRLAGVTLNSLPHPTTRQSLHSFRPSSQSGSNILSDSVCLSFPVPSLYLYLSLFCLYIQRRIQIRRRQSGNAEEREPQFPNPCA